LPTHANPRSIQFVTLDFTRGVAMDHSADIPLFALTAYAKDERADLAEKDRRIPVRIPVKVHSIRAARPWRRAAWQLERVASFGKNASVTKVTAKGR
jgi:hypothetical protein